MAEWFCAAGDRRRQFSTLTDGLGAPLDLNGMTATLRMAEATSGRRSRTPRGSAAVVQSGSSPNYTDQGVVAYDPAAADVAVSGDYLCQWVLTPVTGEARTVPDQAPFMWRITPRL